MENQALIKRIIKVNNIKFTNREVDVIACIVNIKGVKRISKILNISPKTTENYIHHILVKIQGKSQKNIKDFISNSGRLDDFQKYYNEFIDAQILKKVSVRKRIIRNILEIFKRSKLIIGIIVVLAFGLIINHMKNDNQITNISKIESNILQRADILSEISKSLKNSQNIEVSTLVGIGGSGKTTLARNYAQHLRSSFIWEVNASSNEYLKQGFEQIAYALTKDKKERELLKQKIEYDKEDKSNIRLINFVHKKLKLQKDWLSLKKCGQFKPSQPQSY